MVQYLTINPFVPWALSNKGKSLDSFYDQRIVNSSNYMIILRIVQVCIFITSEMYNMGLFFFVAGTASLFKDIQLVYIQRSYAFSGASLGPGKFKMAQLTFPVSSFHGLKVYFNHLLSTHLSFEHILLPFFL